MDFDKKLQYLRKQNKMTQEQLAEKLYVTRTAVSKWESGKGYPNIESLRAISDLFHISIDELLSGEELMIAAKAENAENLRKLYLTIVGIMDLLAIIFVFLPLYWNPAGYAVNLIIFSSGSSLMDGIYWTLIVALIMLGVIQLLFISLGLNRMNSICQKISIILKVIGVLFFSAAKEPYVISLLFFLFLVEFLLLIKLSKIK